MDSLTPKQKEIYCFIDEYRTSRGYSPTQEEIADGVSIHRSTLREHLVGLEKKGYVTLTESVPRSITLTNTQIA